MEPKYDWRSEHMQEFLDNFDFEDWKMGLRGDIECDQQALDTIIYDVHEVMDRVNGVGKELDEKGEEYLSKLLWDCYLCYSSIIESWDYLNRKYGEKNAEL